MAKKIKEAIEITRKKYDWLKGMNPDKLKPEEKKAIEKFEKQLFEENEKRYEKHKDYWTKVYNAPDISFQIDYKQLEKRFLDKYEQMHQPFDKSRLNQVKTILYYFVQDPKFFKSKNLITEIGSSELNPNFNKGLMIVGDYGTGKSSCMNTLQKIFQKTPLSFKMYSAKDIVEHYESYNNDNRRRYLERLENNTVYIDDLKTERLTNNYGVKFNVIDHILFKRDFNRAKTFITCNYHRLKPGDLDATLSEFKEIYSPQVHDRLFGMFNIVEFTGKSMRL